MNKPLEGIKILVVDDEPLLVEAISENLIMYGATVYCAGNGLEAIDSLKVNSVDIILSDMQMPKLDGINFLKNLRLMQANPPPFFFLTGYASEHSVEKLKALGAADILAKPFQISQLIDLILIHLKRTP